jgi:hypothetical protein
VKNLHGAVAIVFKKNILTLVGAYPCGRPVGQAQGRAPTQKHYLKSYSKSTKEILRRFSRFASYAPQNDINSMAQWSQIKMRDILPIHNIL